MYGNTTNSYAPPLSLSWDRQIDEFAYTERQQPAFPATSTTPVQAPRYTAQHQQAPVNTPIPLRQQQAPQPQQHKRVRDERAPVDETEQSKKQKTVHEEQARLEAQASSLHSRREDMLTFMGDTVKQQQTIILGLNKELLQLGSMHRADMAELETNHMAVVSTLRDEISTLKQRVTEGETRIGEQEKQLAEVHALRTTLDQQLAEAVQWRVAHEVALVVPEAPIEPAEKERASRPVAAVVRKRAPVVVDDASLYSWEAVRRASEHCRALYGFTAPQLSAIYAMLPRQDSARHKRGPKEKHDDRHRLLMLLYHLVHYPTIQVLHDRFRMSRSATATALANMLDDPMETLFEATTDGVDLLTCRYRHAAYFLAVQVPQDVRVADSLWCAAQHGHGKWIHVAHDAASGVAMAFCVTDSEEADEAWLADYQPSVHEPAASLRYEALMRERFALTESRYRGALDECESVVRALLAFTNLALDYSRAVVDGVVVREDNPDETASFDH